ncbi:MAG: putative nicotinate phosphoribosyltransferase [Deltaproteobacteria bacterium]|nr:putative nicotinate phosphoribosyltransferase [Deltaproteobacteria bacterium]
MTLLTDLYQLTMVGAYHLLGKSRQKANFDYFFRKIPEEGGFCVAAGLEQLIEYIENIHFEPEDLEYLRSLNLFPPEVLKFFQDLRFTGDLYAVPEGTLVFPQEPIVRVTAPLAEAQFIETALLNILNYQTLIATKAARVCIVAGEDPVIEFGVRRAQGPDGGLSASRAAFIGGARATSNLMAGKVFGIPVRGTVAHSWIESFPSELESFQSYARVYPKNVVLLVDTYDTLLSGVPNAIKVGKELRAGKEGDLLGVRLDSGDLTFLSREARRLLDEAGFDRTRILGSSDLDEWLIESIKKQGAEIDLWGVGTRMVTSYSCPALGGVYKLSAILEDGEMKPKLKVSDDPEKTTNPGVKKVIRFFDEKDFMRGDVLFFEDEVFPENRPVQAFHPMLAHVHKAYPPRYKREEILVPIFQGGKQVYSLPPLADIQARTLQNLHYLRPEHKRLQNPHIYHVSLGEKLFQQKQELIKAAVG